MAWLQIILNSPNRHPGELEDILTAAGAVSITLQDAADQPLFEPPPGETPLWNATCVTGLFNASADAEAIIRHARATLGAELQSRFEILEDKDWEREWIKHYKPMRFGNRLWVCPSWTPPPQPDAVNLMLDPGLAFGTGTHPTTAMCLSWLDELPLKGSSVVDYGCGSGILAIAALLLGAEHVYGIDNDPQALTATRANAERNRIAASRYTLWLPQQIDADLKADVLVANILKGPLLALCDSICGLLKPGGRLGLSGLLNHQAEEIMQAYQDKGLVFGPARQQDEWVCLSGTKNH